MSLASVQEPEVKKNGLFEAAVISGRYGKFILEEASYYPTERVQRLIRQNIFGIGEEQSLQDSERYRRMEQRVGSRRSLTSLIAYPLSHTGVEGDFLLMENEGVHLGLLDIRRILDTLCPEINLSVISQRAFFPFYHHIESIASPPRLSFYTVDEDGSKWSIHCK